MNWCRTDDIPTIFDQQIGILNQLLKRFGKGGGKTGDKISLFPTEQLVNRHTECLARDIVKCDVNSRDSSGQDTSALKILASIHLLPESANVHGVATNEEFAIMLNRTDDS